MKTFFTSDLHFGHGNIISMDKRPFSSVEEMNDELIRRWNKKVSNEDTVYILGDLIWKSCSSEAPKIIKQLNGQKILIKGNHDTFISNNNTAVKMFSEIKDYADITVALESGEKRRCILSHYFIPFYAGHKYNAIHLHGHTHRKKEYDEEQVILKELKTKGYDLRVYNVGCMFWNYYPVTLDEILQGTNLKEYGNQFDYAFEMASVAKEDTGLPYDFWIYSKGAKAKQNKKPHIIVQVLDTPIPVLVSDNPHIPENIKQSGITDFPHLSKVREYIRAYAKILTAHYNEEISDKIALTMLSTLD